MKQTLIVTGDINLMGVQDPDLPFRKIAGVLKRANVVFSNLECCFFDPPDAHATQREWQGTAGGIFQREGFGAPTAAAAALTAAGISAVGNANNVNYGDDAITSSLRALDRIGMPHTGAGLTRRKALASVIVESNKIRFGMVQRTCVYWPNNHEAVDQQPGVAVIKAHTAYRPLIDERAANRPGVPPQIVTWTDPAYLEDFVKQIKALKKKCHVAVASVHWGHDDQVYGYQIELAKAAIDAGADVVMGHGPHFPLAVAVYRNRPIYYGLGSFSFNIGHHGRKHPDWVGLMGRVVLDGRRIVRAGFSFVRHTTLNETVLRSANAEAKELQKLREMSARFATEFKVRGNEIVFLERR